MKINKISGTNFKGRTFQNPLAPITVLVGNNFVGKSSRADALTLAIAGYVPGIEKKPSSIHERLASDKVMAVKVEFDNGKFIGREYSLSPKGSVSCTVSHRGLSDKFAVEPSMIDATEFLALSSKARVQFLFQRLQLESEVPTPASLISKIKPQGEDQAMYLASLEETITDDHESAVTSGLTPQAWLESLQATFETKKKDTMAIANDLMKSQVAMAGAMFSQQDKTVAQERLKAAQAGVKVASEALGAARAARINHNAGKPNSNATESQAAKEAKWKWEQSKSKRESAVLEYDELAKLECCSKCGAKNKGWRKKLEDSAKAEVEFCEAQLIKAKNAWDDAEAALEAKNKEIEAAKASQDFSLIEAINARKCDLDVAETKLLEAQEKMNEVSAREAEENQRQKAAKNMLKANMQAEVLKELCKVIQDGVNQVIAGSIAPFTGRVNKLCAGLLPEPIVYVGGELGMMRNGNFTSWKSFSGTEKALFLCATSLALAEQSEIKCAILDEIGRLDLDNKRKLIQRLDVLIQDGTIEQAILIDAGHLGWWQSTDASEGLETEMVVQEINN